MVISHMDMFLRMGMAAGLGGMIGYERQWSGRPAGLRTHLIVSLASATFMLVSTQFVYFQTYSKDDLVNIDTSRIAASVVSGVGFLGAGVVLRTGVGIQGIARPPRVCGCRPPSAWRRAEECTRSRGPLPSWPCSLWSC